MAISVTLLSAFVLASGVRAVAWVSVLKDALMVIAAVAVGIGIPYIHYGGIGPMFSALAEARPTHLTMPGATPNLGHSWYITTVILPTRRLRMRKHVVLAVLVVGLTLGSNENANCRPGMQNIR
jgi:SSS family solute:Na+ symporter